MEHPEAVAGGNQSSPVSIQLWGEFPQLCDNVSLQITAFHAVIIAKIF